MPRAEDEVGEATWESWDKLLSPIARLQLSTKRGKDRGFTEQDTLAKLYDLAVELRNRLRFSQQRISELKHEVQVNQRQDMLERQQAHERQQAAERQAEAEAQQAMERLRMFQDQVQGLTESVEKQVEQAASLESECARLSRDNQTLRTQLASAAAQSDQANRGWDEAVQARDELQQEIEQLRDELASTSNSALHHQSKHQEMLDELMFSKAQLGEIHHIERLYMSAKDEMDRLDKENKELKDMVQAQAVQGLSKSRIIESLSPGRPKSSPMFLTPQSMGKAGKGRRGRSQSQRSLSPGPGRDRLLDTAGYALSTTAAITRSASKEASGSIDQLPNMAFLGPNSNDYPDDPDKFVFVRVAGGYSPVYAGKEAIPKASGWVPREVVQLVQAFRHAYSLELEWRYWEPLMLMIDEVYRMRTTRNLSNLKWAQKEKLKTVRRKAKDSAAYPTILQAEKIDWLNRQLERTKKGLADLEAGQDNGIIRSLARKQYQLGNQLGQAVDTNLHLRRSLAEHNAAQYEDLMYH